MAIIPRIEKLKKGEVEVSVSGKTEEMKYKLLEDFRLDGIKSLKEFNYDSPYNSFQNGNVFMSAGFYWNGASGPAIDTTTVIVASMVHDLLYRIVEARPRKRKELRKMADEAYEEIVAMYGGNWFRRKYQYAAVRLFGWRHV